MRVRCFFRLIFEALSSNMFNYRILKLGRLLVSQNKCKEMHNGFNKWKVVQIFWLVTIYTSHGSICLFYLKKLRSAITQTDQMYDQGCGVGGKISDSNSTPPFPKLPTPDSGLSKFSDSRLRLLSIKGMKFGCWNQWKSWCIARNLFQQTFQKKLYHFNRNCQFKSVI